MSVYDFEASTIDGQMQGLEQYKGKTLLIVNVASKCGFTPQYKGLEALYRKYKDRGFEILGFPCDQFGHQEPGDEKEIRDFCSLTYDVSFPMFAKIKVNGEGAHPLYTYLKTVRLRGAMRPKIRLSPLARIWKRCSKPPEQEKGRGIPGLFCTA